MKIAPEHTEPKVLRLMGKPDKETLLGFKQKFENMSKLSGKQQFLTYYMIAAHPGCSEADMTAMKQFASSRLRLNPEQVQIFPLFVFYKPSGLLSNYKKNNKDNGSDDDVSGKLLLFHSL